MKGTSLLFSGRPFKYKGIEDALFYDEYTHRLRYSGGINHFKEYGIVMRRGLTGVYVKRSSEIVFFYYVLVNYL